MDRGGRGGFGSADCDETNERGRSRWGVGFDRQSFGAAAAFTDGVSLVFDLVGSAVVFFTLARNFGASDFGTTLFDAVSGWR